MPPKPKRIKKVSDKELQANTLTALKKRASSKRRFQDADCDEKKGVCRQRQKSTAGTYYKDAKHKLWFC